LRRYDRIQNNRYSTHSRSQGIEHNGSPIAAGIWRNSQPEIGGAVDELQLIGASGKLYLETVVAG
jgi:hypothetical protein